MAFERLSPFPSFLIEFRFVLDVTDSHSVYHIALLHRDCFLSKKISILEYQGALLPSSNYFPPRGWVFEDR